jgi:hypothetical protein
VRTSPALASRPTYGRYDWEPPASASTVSMAVFDVLTGVKGKPASAAARAGAISARYQNQPAISVGPNSNGSACFFPNRVMTRAAAGGGV